MRSRLPALASCACALAVLSGGTSALAAADDQVVISEFRARGPAGGNDEFIELRNRSAAPVDISDWLLQTCAAAAPGNASTRATVPVGIVLAPGQSYLLANSAAGGFSGSAAPDQTYATGVADFAAAGFAGIRLVDPGGGVRDGVGAPNSPCREGTGIVTPATNGDQSFERSGGTADTGNNAADFQGPKAGGPQAFSGPGIPATIMQIQGAGHVSPLAGRRVSAVPGVVTAIRPTSFYLQDPTGDGNLATSDGILVFGVNTSALTVGTAVRIDGHVTEFRPGGGDNLPITELDQATVAPAGLTTPIVPTVLGAGGRTPPNVVIEDDASGDLSAPGAGGNTFDPASDGIDFYESLEGMLLQVNDAALVNATRSFGEITLLADAGANATGLRTARGGIMLAPTDANPERITVDDEILRDRITPRPPKAMPDMNVGARILSPVVGPLDYSFENYKIQALTPPVFVESPIEREVAAVAHPSDLTVATFNVENLAATNAQSKFDELAGMIVHNLRSPAIVAIEEVQDDNGTVNDGNVSAARTWARLLAAIDAAGGPAYDFRQIDPVNNADGGAPGGNIRVGLMFRTDLPDFRFVDRPGGTSTNDTAVVGAKNHPRLTFSPGRLGATSEAFVDTRKPLAGEFVWKDRTVFVVANHFSSKGDDQGIFSRWQPPTNFSEGPRHGQAAIVNAFADDVLARDRDANVIVLGDINDFEFSRTIEILEGNELTTLMRILPPTERYSYVFEGNSQVLDQILVSDAIFKRSPAYDVVHVNSEFADARQASDHDPQVAYLRPKGTGAADCC
jgi:uncharacterized protein